MTTIDEVIERLKEYSISEPDIVPPPTPEQILEAENQLNIKFPPSFLVFLEKAGAYQLPFWETYWVGDESLGYRNIVTANHRERNDPTVELPDFLITFHDNGCGDNLCFDTRHPNSEGEYPIVFWDHELSRDDNLNNLSPLYPDFTSWLQDEIDMAAEMADEDDY